MSYISRTRRGEEGGLDENQAEPAPTPVVVGAYETNFGKHRGSPGTRFQ